MHYTLHLTNACNMACRYCYVCKGAQNMSEQTARRAVDMALSGANEQVGIIFFGGEPLLRLDTIKETVDYARHAAKRSEKKVYFKITTNGLLLDDDFIEYSQCAGIFVALSHDGVREAHDQKRVALGGEGTFDALEPRARALLAARPYAPVMMTVSPDTVSHYADGVEYLYKLGFRYLICSLNYAAIWNDAALSTLRRQLKLLADFYERQTLAEDKFYLSPFEVKIASHITGACADRCELGKRQISVAPDGKLYPCVQFVGDLGFSIGDVFSGIDEQRRLSIFDRNDVEKETCRDCAVRTRCNHHCGCLNRQATGSLDSVAPALCAHERIILPIADRLAERLYKRRSALFIHKQYNDMFPLISLAEDRQR